jgi:hypothetical protein
VEHKTIPVGQLLVDADNPRHEPAKSQRDAILALIGVERQKLVVLASDIVDHGLSPIDRMLVIRKGRNFIAVEGNRRLVAIKLLSNPGLADGTAISTAIKRLAKTAVAPSVVDCAIVPSRAEAEHWMELRHGGQAEGAGVVPWNALASNRFSHKPGSQAAKAIGFLDAVAAGFPDNTVIRDLIKRVAETRLTTLGRLVADPNFKLQAGLIESGGTLLFTYPADALQDFLEHVLGDLAADVGVSELKSKAQRTVYLNSTPKPDPKQVLPAPRPLSEAPSVRPTVPAKPRSRPTKPQKPFKELDLREVGAKTQALLAEFRKLDVDATPNAAGVLARVILELAVDEFVKRSGITYDRDLKKRIRKCLGRVDPTNTAPQFQSVRAGLQDGSSLYAVATLHGFVHNPHYHADGTTVRSIASNLAPFLQALNDALG